MDVTVRQTTQEKAVTPSDDRTKKPPAGSVPPGACQEVMTKVSEAVMRY
jgi:hypothetical protein